ncbi:MAG: glycoside hydrolase family 3 N-terminal domain-containing protein [Methyloceanibacter sp.]
MRLTPIAAGFLLTGLLGLALRADIGRTAEPDGLETLRQMVEADELLDRMIGQMIMVGFQGDSERAAGVIAVRDQLAKGEIGGVVLYPDNIRSPRQLRLLTAYLNNANSSLVPLIAVDQEGGLVQRLTPRNGYGRFPSARTVGRDPALRTPEGAHRLYARMARELAQAGINVNFGPVVDLSVNPGNPVIVRRKRSFGSDPEAVTLLAGAFIAAHRQANVVTAAKHYPGHGSSWSDSHKALPDISRSWREVELDPYVSLSRDGLLDMVMVGHLYHPRFSDGDRLPASLSARAIEALRAKGYIGFRGVVVSDDLEMGAVRLDHALAERVILAVNAGIDLLVFSNVKSRDTDLGVKIHAIIADAVRDGRIDRARIEVAYGKIGLLKRRLMQHDLPGKW